jgi:RNA polymerase sporulation-specific sigma factor
MIRQGDADAFVELCNRYFPLVRAKASTFHGIALEADDLWQEGLLGLFRAAMTYSPEGSASFQTYAGVCISNQMISAYRVSANKNNTILNQSLSLQEMEDAGGDQLPCDEMLDPESLVIAKENVQAVNDHLNASLSAKEKSVLQLYLNGCSYREIGNRLSISEKAADNAMQRVRKKLKHHLSKG